MYKFPYGALVLVDFQMVIFDGNGTRVERAMNVPMVVCAREPGQTQTYTMATPLIRVRWDIQGGTSYFLNVPLSAIQNAADFQGEPRSRWVIIQWAHDPTIEEVFRVQRLLPLGLELRQTVDVTSFMVFNRQGQTVDLPAQINDQISCLPFILGAFSQSAL